MDTSWQKVGDSSHYFHHHLVIPKSIALLDLKPDDKVLDIGCGQGLFARELPDGVSYLGLDNAPGLIGEAQKADKNPKHKYVIADATNPLNVSGKFTHATMLLSLQNIKDPQSAVKRVREKLEKGGKLLIVLNHPMFRIPRQSSWEIDVQNKIEYRRINRYMTPIEIPINTHPGQKGSGVTWTFHHSLSDYSKYLFEAGFTISLIEEWISDKQSEGRAARQENRARIEFPMFMTILAYAI